MFNRKRKLPRPPKWGNGRKEFMAALREPINPFTIQSTSADILLPHSAEFSSEKEKKMVWSVYNSLGKSSLTMRYQSLKGKETTREVTPFIVIFYNGYWGFFATCHLRDDIRWFHFDRILGVDPIDLQYEMSHTELVLRMLHMPTGMQLAISDAIQVLDPELHEKYRGLPKLSKPPRETLSAKMKKKRSNAEVGRERKKALLQSKVKRINAIQSHGHVDTTAKR